MIPELAPALTWAQTAALNPNTPICVSCGGELAPTLARLASLRCHDCRNTHAPISARLVQLPAPRAA